MSGKPPAARHAFPDRLQKIFQKRRKLLQISNKNIKNLRIFLRHQHLFIKMSLLMDGTYDIGSAMITSIFIIVEYMFHYFVAFVNYSVENLHHLIISVLMIFIAYYSSVPYDKTINAKEISYPKKKTRRNDQKLPYKENLELVDLTEYPPLYPNGWIPLIESKDLAIGQSMPVTALGHQFVIFRGKTGKCFILNAYCPHLGANLGVCGKVLDDCIQCPFHGWIFSGHDGSCVKIPYTDKVPEFAKTKTWLSIEQCGFIYVWYHADGQQPSWIPTVIPEIEQGLWSYKGRIQYNIHCHIQEICENLSDFHHANYLHRSSILDFHDFHPNNWWNFFKHEWSEFSWTVHPLPNQHMTTAIVKLCSSIFGITLPWTQITIEIKQIGPAISHIHFSSTFGKLIHIINITPGDRLKIKMVHYFYTPYRFFHIFGSIAILLVKFMTERDISIWNFSTYLKTPLLVTEDKTIAKFRKWYSQFYSENSCKLNKKTVNW